MRCVELQSLRTSSRDEVGVWILRIGVIALKRDGVHESTVAVCTVLDGIGIAVSTGISTDAFGTGQQTESL